MLPDYVKMDPQRVRAIGAAHRLLIAWYAAYVLVGLPGRVLGVSLARSPDEDVQGLAFILTLATLAVDTLLAVAVLIWTYRLVRALEKGAVALWVVLMAVPVVNFVGLLMLSDAAGKALRIAGLKVGLLGPSKFDVEQYGGVDDIR